MEPTGDKNWAKSYLIDPLTEPQPSQETGPGSRFRPDSATSAPISKILTPPKTPTTPTKNSSNRPPITTAAANVSFSRSPRGSGQRSPQPHPQEQRESFPNLVPISPSSHRKEALAEETNGTRPRRTSSLRARYDGDKSHMPLNTLSREKKTADRARHVTKKHHIQPDTIDSLGSVGPAYHIGGPYDATLLARNNSLEGTPVQALADSNAEAIKATPRERLVDSLQYRRPLDGVATYAPGETDMSGTTYNYQPGDNMMIDNAPEGGAYKRWPGVEYRPDDIKGKGEPSYSLEKALKDSKINDDNDPSVGREAIEMTSAKTFDARDSNGRVDGDGDRLNGSGSGTGSGSKRLSGGVLKKRFGSIKKHLQPDN